MAKIKNCEWCGREFEDKHRDGKRFCGRSCASYYKNATYGNPQKGKTGELNPNWKGARNQPCLNCGKSLEGKAYVGNVYCSRKCYADHRLKKDKVTIQCETCEKPFDVLPHDSDSRRFCSHNCYAKHPETIQRTKDIHTGKQVTELQRQSMSMAASKRLATSLYTYGRNGYYGSLKAGSIFYRSSYELAAYQILDNDITVTHYEPEPLVIEYVDLIGNARRYRPDILIWKNEKTLLVEIKPLWKLSDPATQIKIEAGKQYAARKGWSFEVWTEKELGL